MAGDIAAEKPKRKGMSKRLRFDVFKRDGFKCMYCGNCPPAVLLHVDHINPVARGGKNDNDNLVTACEPCNQGKSDVPLSVVPQSLADKAAETREREEQIKGYQAVMAERRVRLDDECWEVANVYIAHFKHLGIRKDWLLSIKHFIEKLGMYVCIDAMERALSKKSYSKSSAFSYFCGICWNKIREAQA